MKPYTFEEIDQINDVIRGIIAESSGEYDWVRPWVAKKHPDFSSD